MVFREPKDQKV